MFLPLHVHSLYSLCDGFIKQDKLIQRLTDYEYPACTITDHGNMSGCVDFSKTLHKAGIKPILGVEAYCTIGPSTIKDATSKNLHMVILAKNKAGFTELCQILTEANKKENFYRKPRISLSYLEELSSDNLLYFTGHPGSILYEVAKNDFDAGVALATRLKSTLKNVFLESQRICASKEECDMIVDIGKKVGLPVVAAIDAHYIDRSDAYYQRILLCSTLNIRMKEWASRAGSLSGFFKHDYFHLPSPQEMTARYTDSELKESAAIIDMCDSYNLSNKPSLPKFDCDNEQELLKKLCRDGWRSILSKYGIDQDVRTREKYAERVLMELDVIAEYNLAGYFLIVQDFVNWVRKQDIFCNTGRGSASGSLVSYLTSITLVDPIPYNLLFSRFLNRGRFTKDHFEYPDIDVDLPTNMREPVINYLKEKYGHDYVGQVATFNKLQGAGAIKEVFRANDVCSPDEINKITRDIPQHGAIAGELEEQQETSIIKYTLNNTSVLSEYCQLDDNGELVGDYAPYIKDAIAIEGCIKSHGVHAAGVVISPIPLKDICPILDGNICSIDMDGLKEMGIVKFDLLGVAAYDKLGKVNDLLRNNYV